MLVKKSTLCWLFSNKSGRLSSDRLLRFRTTERTTSLKKLNSAKVNKKRTRSNSRKRSRSESEKSDTSMSSESCLLESEFEVETFSDEELTLSDTLSVPQILIEEYYAVCYQSWYIGRVIEKIDDERSRVKFLKSELDAYVWPKIEDTRRSKKYIYILRAYFSFR